MTDPEPLADTVHGAMMRSIGHCLTAWANVEFQLGDAFLRYHGREAQVATLVWDSIVSLDARITMLQRLLKLRFPSGEVHDDTVLLLNETRRLYKQRNEVAHATLIRIGSTGDFALEPFFVLGNEKPKLRTDDLRSRAMSFAVLSMALAWLRMAMDWDVEHRPAYQREPPTPPPAFEQPPPDLVRVLRDAESQRRKEQSERQKLLRHAQKLAEAGCLPDWPVA